MLLYRIDHGNTIPKMYDDDVVILRRRDADLDDAVGRMESPLIGTSGSLLVQTTTITTYPTSAARFYAVQPVWPSGTESENTAGSFTNETDKFLALNIGASIPPSGTKVLIESVGGRWVFRYDG